MEFWENDLVKRCNKVDLSALHYRIQIWQRFDQLKQRQGNDPGHMGRGMEGTAESQSAGAESLPSAQ